MTLRREVVIGHTVLGRPIEAVHFTAVDYAKPRPPAILFGAIHGDEPVSQLMMGRLADELVERPPGRDTWIVPVVNVDGLLAGTRNNANDVDLNRNFACPTWGEHRRPGYNPGKAAEDQPETWRAGSVSDRRFDRESLAGSGVPAGLGHHLPEAVRRFAEEQPLPLPAGLLAAANHPGRQHLRVIENK